MVPLRLFCASSFENHQHCPACRFVYEEEGDAAAFFVPYVWTLVVQRCGSIPWDLAKISLFRPRQLGPAPRDSGSLDGQ